MEIVYIGETSGAEVGLKTGRKKFMEKGLVNRG